MKQIVGVNLKQTKSHNIHNLDGKRQESWAGKESARITDHKGQGLTPCIQRFQCGILEHSSAETGSVKNVC